jgi:hypothetical protein
LTSETDETYKGKEYRGNGSGYPFFPFLPSIRNCHQAKLKLKYGGSLVSESLKGPLSTRIFSPFLFRQYFCVHHCSGQMILWPCFTFAPNGIWNHELKLRKEQGSNKRSELLKEEGMDGFLLFADKNYFYNKIWWW